MTFIQGRIDMGKRPLFSLGRVVATPGAIALMSVTNTNPFSLLALHATGDWGECDPQDAQSNNEAVVNGSRILSAYRLPLAEQQASDSAKADAGAADRTDNRIWCITEADRSVTTLLLPEDY